MRRFGANKVALHFRRKKIKQVLQRSETKTVYSIGDLTAQNEIEQAQEVVRVLYKRYERQMQRYVDYRNLFCFMGFVVWFLATLYLQRTASVAYEVHSTMMSILDPGTKTMGSVDEVYSYLDNVMQTIWTDPLCGDGICDQPFEYAAYGRFGCRADCGQLSKIQDLTQLQVDLYYDFSHPLGSIPSSDLMQQAKWNLCPNSTQYADDCYYDEDQGFSQIKGTMTRFIDDAPDGSWDLIVKRDIFSKIQGAVRDYKKLMIAGVYYKILIAAVAAQAEQNFEINLLRQAINISSQPYWTYVSNTLVAMNNTNAEFVVDGMRNASCICQSVPYNPLNATLNTTVPSPFSESQNTSLVFGAAVLLPFNQSVDAINPNEMMTQDLSTYNSLYCNSGMRAYIMPPVNMTSNGTRIYGSVANGTNYTTLFNVSKPVDMANTTELSLWCHTTLTSMMQWRTNMTQTVQRLVLDRRLGDQRTTGKISARNAIVNGLQAFLNARYPELVNPIYTTPRGTNGLTAPLLAQLSVLAQQYVDGDVYSRTPQYAALNLTRSRVYNVNITLPSLAARATARLAEVQFQQNDTHLIPIIGPSFNFSVGTLLSSFYNSSTVTNASSLPAPSDAALGMFSVNYNLAFWQGNNTAYMRCNLPVRQPSYIGVCMPMNVSCVPVPSNASNPFNCSYLVSGEAVPGNMSNTSYREDCQLPCDRRLDANSICECYSTCSTNEYCECNAYFDVFQPNAALDAEFRQVRNEVQSIANWQEIASVDDKKFQGRRRLMQTDSLTTNITNVLTAVSAAKAQEDAIAAQMSGLQTKVDTANALALARANDQTLIDLINAGRADIAAGQSKVEGMLQTIIGNQQKALEAANAAANALSNIQSLATQQAAATAALQKAIESQLSAIKVATKQGVITIPQALALWSRARREKATSDKASKLANLVCISTPTLDNFFDLDNQNEPLDEIPRIRTIGMTNRIVGGMLLHQWRTNDTICPPSKFDKIENKCTGSADLQPFGVDPIFKAGTTLYNPDYEDGNQAEMVQFFYNCSALSRSTYDVWNPTINLTQNKEPYCAELFNPNNLPYAFYHYPLPNKPDGFPIWVDIDLDAKNIERWSTYMKEGLFLDTHTSGLTAELITYNAPLKIFGFFHVKFTFEDGGSIDVKYRTYTVRIELYDNYDDEVRRFMEVVTTIMIIGMCAYQLYGCILAQIKRKNFLAYFNSGAARFDLISNALLLATFIIWWQWVDEHAAKFKMDLRYDVYQALNAGANFMALNDNGLQLNAAWEAIASMARLIDVLDWYYFLHSISILLLICRILRLMDFQPRLGVVTRALWIAGPDLIHFAIVAGAVFVGYAMMAHLIFGNSLEEFNTFGESINTCFIILLGVIDVQANLMALGGLQATAGALFFWSFELLVFMVLLNFLLAIIVDAFSEVKEGMKETAGVHTELYNMMSDKIRMLVGKFRGTYVSDKKLATMLREWAGDAKPEDINIDDLPKYLVVNNEQLSEETLLKVLQQCLLDAPDENETDAEDDGSKKKGWFGRRKKAKKPIREELAVASKYIVDRFGEVQFKDEDGDGQPDEPEIEVKNLEDERDNLASALERLADVQRELAEGQRALMSGQKQLAEQQAKLITSMTAEQPK